MHSIHHQRGASNAARKGLILLLTPRFGVLANHSRTHFRAYLKIGYYYFHSSGL
jgi:uncharacterized membrane protein